MENRIREIIETYKDKVQKETIGCGLGPYRDDVKREGAKITKELFDKIIGDKPPRDDGGNYRSSPEYLEWFKKALVFSELFDAIGKARHDYTGYYFEPTSLSQSYGPRD